jgi:hypothetical protein
MGKRSKEHRKKVANRNVNINNQKKSLNKLKEKMIMDIINRESEKGLLDANVNDELQNNINLDGPQI